MQNVLLCINDIVTPFICGRGPETDKFTDLFYKFLGEGLCCLAFFSLDQCSLSFVPELPGGSPRTGAINTLGEARGMSVHLY